MKKDLTNVKLFEGISQEQIESFLDCVKAKVLNLKKGQTLYTVGQKPENVALVLSGFLFVTQSDYWGNNTILSTVTENNVFGGGFAYSGVEKIPFSVEAGTDTQVLYVNKDLLLSPCGKCDYHNKIIRNLIKIVSARNVSLIEKIKNLSQRTTRQKILSLLYSFSVSTSDKKIILPYTRQQMADYLCVDRASLSRELSLLQKEKLIKYHKNVFFLLTDSSSVYE